MTTQTTPAHAIELAELIDAGEASAEAANAMRSLANHVEALTADLAAEKLFSSQAMESVTEIAEQRDALKADAERIDFLIANCAYVVSDASCCDGFWLNYMRPDGSMWVQSTEHTTPREAIDAAMKAAS